MIRVIGDSGRSKYNRDLGRQVNEEWEKKQKKKKLDEEIKKPTDKKVDGIIEEIEKQYGKPDFGVNQYNRSRYEEITGVFKVYMDLHSSRKEEIPISMVKSLGSITKEKIYDFCFYSFGLRSLSQHKDFKWATAFFLTALMQVSEDDEFILPVQKVPEMHYMGFKLENKKVLIKGNVGDSFTQEAKSCVFYVEGDVGDYIAPEATNCHILIESKKAENEGLKISDSVGRRTRIFLMDSQAGKYKRVYPR